MTRRTSSGCRFTIKLDWTVKCEGSIWIPMKMINRAFARTVYQENIYKIMVLSRDCILKRLASMTSRKVVDW